MGKWSFVARGEDVAEDGPHHVSAGGVDAVLIRVDGELHAFEGLCPHQGALLGEGELLDGKLVCRNHRWCFDGSSGKREGGPECLQRYPLREKGGRVELDLGAADAKGIAEAGRHRADLPGPRGLPVVGNALQLSVEGFHLDLERWAREYGDVYRYELGTRPITMVAEPLLIAEALKQRPDIFTRFEIVRPVFNELGIQGVFSDEGEEWRPQRRLVMGALNPRRVKAFFPMLRTVTERLLARWREAADEERPIDLQEDLMRFTVDVTTRLAFSEETNSVGGETSFLLDNLGPVFPLLAKRINAVVPYWRLFKLPSDKRADQSLADVRGWLSEVVARTRAELADDPSRAENPTNFLEAMLVARDVDGQPFADDVIFGNALQLLLAGEDTTANTLAWAVHLLLDAPEASDVLCEAVDRVLGGKELPDTMELTGELDAVEAVANETMRLKPVAPVVFLSASRDTMVGDLAVSKGTSVGLLTRLPGLDPDRVNDPERFDPRRWDDPKLLATMQRSGAFVPFGSGPRICPGRSLALLEIRMVLSMLFKNFELQRVGRSEDVQEIFGFTVAPRGLQVKLRRRN